MMHKPHAIVLILVLTATAAMAHQGVRNETVKARMVAMGEIAQNTKILGRMSKGAVDFDAAQARQAAMVIARQANRLTGLFQTQAMDPKSEALPVIWAAFGDFSSLAEDLRITAAKAATTIDTQADLRAALGRIGATCKSCHQTYRN